LLTERGFELWGARLQLADPVRRLIADVRSAPPARRVGSRRRNVSGRYPSRKMGLTIQFESHTSELVGIYSYEHDSRVVEYYDQPALSAKLNYVRGDGRRVSYAVTPDFLVLERDGAFLDEWKTETELVRLAAKDPALYTKEDGAWRSPPREEATERLGLSFRLRTRDSVGDILDRNLRFLDDYLRAAVEPDPALAAALTEAVSTDPGISAGELLSALMREGAADCLYALIAGGQLFVDLATQPLAEPFHAAVYPSAELAASLRSPEQPIGTLVQLTSGTRLEWDGRPWDVVNPGPEGVSLRDAAGQLVTLDNHEFQSRLQNASIRELPHSQAEALPPEGAALLRAASPKDLDLANQRYRQIVSPNDDESALSPRSLARLRRSYREAQLRYGCGFIGLLPQPRKGNKTRKREAQVLGVIEEQISTFYRSKDAPGKTALYGLVVEHCQRLGLEPPSYKTVSKALHAHDAHTVQGDREGQKVAYGSEQFYWHLDASTPRHGDRPWEIGHADHTKLDIELVCSKTGTNLGRPWLSLLVDAHSRRVLAFWLTFDPPSYRSLMMLVRRCVALHSRLPETIVVDGGAEFGSIYFETLLAAFEITKKVRPGAPRFGSVCERLFGMADERLIHNLRGNTKLMRNVRTVTAEVTPSKRAVWDLWSLDNALGEWFHEVYDGLDHPSLGQSPRDTYNARIELSGTRPQRWVADDETFRMLTLPSTQKGTVKVDPSRGVKVNYINYWNPRFRDPALGRRDLPVRYDPIDVRHAFVFADGDWIECESQELRSLPQISERELRFATAELLQRRRNVERRRPLTARDIAVFLKQQKDNENLLLLRLRDFAQREVLAPHRANQLLGWGAPAPFEADAMAPPTALEVVDQPDAAASSEPPEQEISASVVIAGETNDHHEPQDSQAVFGEYTLLMELS